MNTTVIHIIQSEVGMFHTKISIQKLNSLCKDLHNHIDLKSLKVEYSIINLIYCNWLLYRRD